MTRFNHNALCNGATCHFWQFDRATKKGRDFRGKDSAAAMLAGAINDNVLVIEKIKEDTYWLCAIEANLVLMGTDIIINEAEARHNIDDLLTLSSFTIKGTSSESFGGDDEPFISLISAGTGDVDPKIIALNNAARNFVLTCFFGIFLLAVLGYIYVYTLHPLLFPPIDMSDQKQAADEAAKRQRKMAAQVALAKALETDLSQPSVKQYWHTVQNKINSIKALNIGGSWIMSEINCQTDNCFFKWTNKDASSQVPLVNATGDICSVIFMPQAEGAQCSTSINVEARTSANITEGNYVDVYTLREQFLMLQRFGAKTLLGMPSYNKSSKDALLLDESAWYKTGKWTIKGNLLFFEEIANTLSQNALRTVWADRLQIKCSGNNSCNYTIGGNYVANK